MYAYICNIRAEVNGYRYAWLRGNVGYIITHGGYMLALNESQFVRETFSYVHGEHRLASCYLGGSIYLVSQIVEVARHQSSNVHLQRMSFCV